MKDDLENFVREVSEKYRNEIEEIIELQNLLERIDEMSPKEVYVYKFDYTSNE
jgi:hypothetical protein